MNMNSYHYYASTAFGWAVGAARQEAIAAVARQAGSDLIKRNMKVRGGLYCWTCKVDLPQSATYDINGYAPVGVPTSDARAVLIQSIKGAFVEAQ